MAIEPQFPQKPDVLLPKEYTLGNEPFVKVGLVELWYVYESNALILSPKVGVVVASCGRGAFLPSTAMGHVANSLAFEALSAQGFHDEVR